MNKVRATYKGSQWYALMTRYKCEKYVAKNLEAKGVTTYLPLLETTKVYTSRKKTYVKPLINCYVFTYIDEAEYSKVLQTEYVYGFLTIAGKKAIVKEDEILLLKKVVGELDDVEVFNDTLTVGNEVEIISGNLTGLTGFLIEEKGKNSFVVRLSSMDVSLSMTVDKQHLRYIR